jgi:hypothetical protein
MPELCCFSVSSDVLAEHVGSRVHFYDKPTYRGLVSKEMVLIPSYLRGGASTPIEEPKDAVCVRRRLGFVGGGLYSQASSRYPSAGSIGAIIRSCIEGNRRAWGSLTNSVDDDFE